MGGSWELPRVDTLAYRWGGFTTAQMLGTVTYAKGYIFQQLKRYPGTMPSVLADKGFYDVVWAGPRQPIFLRGTISAMVRVEVGSLGYRRHRVPASGTLAGSFNGWRAASAPGFTLGIVKP